MSDRPLTTVRDVYPSAEDFAAAVRRVLDQYTEESEVLLPTTLAVSLGVPEISIRREITDGDYGPAVERLYMTALDSCVRAIFLGKVSNAQAAIGIMKEMFSWFEGCLAFLKEDGLKSAENEGAMQQAMKDLYREMMDSQAGPAPLDAVGISTDDSIGKTDAT